MGYKNPLLWSSVFAPEIIATECTTEILYIMFVLLSLAFRIDMR